MLKLLIGSAALVGVLGFVACNNTGGSGTLADCPSTITISGTSYTTPSCQLKVGSTVTIEAFTGHPLIGDTATPLFPSSDAAKTSSFVYVANVANVGQTLGFQCQIHGGIGMKGSIKIIAQ